MTERMPRAKRREQIAEACLQLIGEHGLKGFTVAQIARVVGLRDGSLFRHFENKEDIVEAALDRLEEILEETLPRGVRDPIERLRAFVTARVRAVIRHPGVRAFVLSDDLARAGGDRAGERVRRLRLQAQSFMRSCIQEAVEQGLVDPAVDPEDLVILLHGAVIGIVFLAGPEGGEDALDARAEHVVDTLLRLIRR